MACGLSGVRRFLAYYKVKFFSKFEQHTRILGKELYLQTDGTFAVNRLPCLGS